MGARHHRELEAWQFADQVRQAFIDLTSRPPAKQDLGLCDQASRAAGSACRNIAEGFYRYSHREFANFLNIARGSLGELLDLADEAKAKRYLSDKDHEALDKLIDRAMATTAALRRYVSSTRAPNQPGNPRHT